MNQGGNYDRWGRPSLVTLISVLLLALGATAGSLTPPGAVSSTMHSLSEIYDSIASATFDSSAIVANQNGSLLANLKYIENQIVWASVSPNIWNLNSGNVGIGTTTPADAKLVIVASTTVGEVIQARTNTPTTIIDDDYAVLSVGNSNTTNGTYAGISFNSKDSTGSYTGFGGLTMIFQNHTAGATASDLTFSTILNDSIIERMRITSAGTTSVFALSGAGLTDCDGTVGNMALNWNISNGMFSCTMDDIGGGGGALIEVRESSAANGSLVSSLSFNAGGFDVSFSGTEAIMKLDYGNGPASRSIAQTITGAWTFTAASNQFTNTLEIKTASISTLTVKGQTSLANASVSGNFDPAIDNTYNLGSTALRWKSIFLGPGSIHIGTAAAEASISYDVSLGRLAFAFGGPPVTKIFFHSNGTGEFLGGLTLGDGVLDGGDIGFRGRTAGNEDNFTIRTSTDFSERFEILGPLDTPFISIASTGNVGIGTINPGAKLEVTGDIYLSSGSNRTIKIPDAATARNLTIAAGSGLSPGGGASPGAHLFLTGGAGAGDAGGTGGNLYLDGGGAGGGAAVSGYILLATQVSTNVGIGIAVPTGKLHISADSTNTDDATAALKIANITTPSRMIQFGHNGTSGYIQSVREATSGTPLLLNPNGYSGGAGGNVGIGTTTPGVRLEVAGSIIASLSATNFTLLTGTSIDISGTAASIDFKNLGAAEDFDFRTIWQNGVYSIVSSVSGTALEISSTNVVRVDLVGTATAFGVCHDSSLGVDNTALVDCNATAGADYMEMYPMTGGIEEGEIMIPSPQQFVLDTNNNKVPKLIRSTRPYQDGIVGITSIVSQAGDFNSIGHNINTADNPKPLALSGRVLLKVSTQNGPISVGDRITSSDIPGVGMKATAMGMTVGTALEDLPTLSPGSYRRIMVFVGAQYWAPAEALNPPAGQPNQTASSSWLEGTFQNLFASIVDAFRSVFGIVFEQGKIQADQLCAGTVCVNEQQLQQLLNSAGGVVPSATPTPSPTETPTPSPSDIPTSTPEPTPTPTPIPTETSSG